MQNSTQIYTLKTQDWRIKTPSFQLLPLFEFKSQL